MTEQVARGIAVADEPEDGSSFGQSRVLAIAKALKSLDPGDSFDTFKAGVEDELFAEGFDPDRPHQNF
jgi:hypothetical protein